MFKRFARRNYKKGLEMKKCSFALLWLMVYLMPQDSKATLEELERMRAAELSGITLEGEKLTRTEHRDYYYNLLLKKAREIENNKSLNAFDKAYLVSFSKTLAANVKKGYDKEPGVNLKELKKELLPIFDEAEKAMEALVNTKGAKNRSDYYSLLALIKVNKSTFLPFASRLKYFSKSKKLFEKAEAINPREYSALIGLGLSYYFPPALFGGNLKKSLVFLNKINDDPEAGKAINYLAYVWKSQVYLKKKDSQKAKEMLRKAEEIFPQGGLLLFARNLLSKGKRIGS